MTPHPPPNSWFFLKMLMTLKRIGDVLALVTFEQHFELFCCPLSLQTSVRDLTGSFAAFMCQWFEILDESL